MDSPINIWDISTVKSVQSDETYPVKKFPNSLKVEADEGLPQIGDLVIFEQKEIEQNWAHIGKWSHVAVVTGVDSSFVYVGEQCRWDWGRKWTGNYTRKLALTNNGECTLASDMEDWTVVGWMRISK